MSGVMQNLPDLSGGTDEIVTFKSIHFLIKTDSHFVMKKFCQTILSCGHVLSV